MNWISRLERKYGRFCIPNLISIIVGGQILVYAIELFVNQFISVYLGLSRSLLLMGQVWRLITFVFIPFSGGGPLSVILGIYFTWFIGTALEKEWGDFRFNLYFLLGMIGTALGCLVTGIPADTYCLSLSLLLAFAMLYPEVQVLLFFVIPIKMKWMALIDVALILVAVIQNLMYGSWVGALLPLASFVNYFIFTWPFWGAKLGVLRRRADPKVVNFKRVQKQAQKQAKATGGYRHKCAVCGITDADDPNMEFRYCSKCDGYYCYCMNHINNHVHIHHD